MAEIVNLRMARKVRDRAAEAAASAVNRAKHGRSKSERAGQQAEADRAARLLGGIRRDTD